MEDDDHEKKGKNTAFSSSPPVAEETHPAPWLDLPDPLTDLILERLPLSDYLRFPAVCRKWRSIQSNHRLRHSPGPPPMAHPLPWLISSLDLHLDSSLNCYSPFDQTLRRLPIPATAARHSICLASSYGWLLVLAIQQEECWHLTSITQPFLINPVSRIRIPLPLLWNSNYSHFRVGALSAPPSDPNCLLLLADSSNIYLLSLSLCKENVEDCCWDKFPIPKDPVGSLLQEQLHSAIYCGGKFYCITIWFDLYIIDPLLDTPFLNILDLTFDQMPRQMQYNRFLLTESNGEVLLVAAITNYDDILEGFQVFVADFSKDMWVCMESIGHRALFVSDRGSFSLLAADVGCKKNCIYYTPCILEINAYLDEPWKAFGIFDLETGSIIHEQPVPDLATKEDLCCLDKYHLHWVMPRLDYINCAETGCFERVVAEDS